MNYKVVQHFMCGGKQMVIIRANKNAHVLELCELDRLRKNCAKNVNK